MTEGGSEAEAKPIPPGGRGVLWWSVGAILSLSVVGLFCWVVLTPYLQVRAALKGASDAESRIARLGGAEPASRKLGFYVQLPDKVAPAKVEAVELLGYCGRPALRVLARVLGNQDPRLRRMAVDELAGMGPAAVPALERALGDTEPAVRLAALRSIGAIEWRTDAALQAIIRALSDGDATVRYEAVSLAEELGRRAEAARPALAGLLQDPATPQGIKASVSSAFAGSIDITSIRCRAAYALIQIGPAASKQDFLALLADTDPKLRALAAWGLSEIGRDARDAVPLLVKALGDQDALVRAYAAGALKKIRGGPPAR